jgi:hypothetical protein
MGREVAGVGPQLCCKKASLANEIIAASLDELRAARLNGRRLLALCNGLADAERLTKIGNRAAPSGHSCSQPSIRLDTAGRSRHSRRCLWRAGRRVQSSGNSAATALAPSLNTDDQHCRQRVERDDPGFNSGRLGLAAERPARFRALCTRLRAVSVSVGMGSARQEPER